MTIATNLGQVFRHIDDHLTDHVTLLQEYVRQPSVSIDGVGMRECAQLVAEHYRALGCQEIEIVETETFPGVWAFYDAGAPLTLVNYNMYDVRPVGDESRWTHPPFGADIDRRGDCPAVLYGRGACVPKGPDVAWLSALRAVREVLGTLPINIAFLAEGDEILGSPSYGGLLERFSERLGRIDGCIYPRATQNASGELPLVLGYKTFLTLEIRVTGRSWGRGPVEDAAHSATRAIVDSPAWRLAQALSSLVGPDGEIAIGPWLTGLHPAEPPQADRRMMADLVDHFAGREWSEVIPGLAGTGVKTYAQDVTGTDVLTRYIYGSGLNVQGLYAGYTGPGTRTYTIPNEATALLDARLVTTQTPDQLIQGFEDHLAAHGFGDVEVEVKSAYPGSSTPASSRLVEAFLAAAERAGGHPIIWPRQGYGGPWSIFAERFGAPIVFATGIGHGGGVGQPDEYIVIDGGGHVAGLPEMERFYVDLLFDFAGR